MQRFTSFECILFDCDGVLVDSEMIVNKYFSIELSRFGIHLGEEELIKRFTGKSSKTVYPELEQSHRVKFTQAEIDCIERRLHERLAEEVSAIDGICIFLNRLQEPGKPVYAVASSGSFEKIHRSLNRSGLADYFKKSNIFSAQLVPHSKPAPDLFLYAARQMGILPHKCLVIEDSVSGIKAAQSAGMSVIAFAGASHARYDWYHKLLKENDVQIIESYSALMRELFSYPGDF